MDDSWKEWGGAALIGLAVVVGSSAVTRAGERDQQVRAEVTAIRQEFCAALYASGTCARLTAGAKNRVLRGAIFSGPDKKSLDTLAPILTRHGWVQVPSEDPAHTLFCRAGYAADFVEYADYTQLDFYSDEPVCLEQAP